MESFQSLTVSQREQFMVANRIFEIYNVFSNARLSSQKFMLEIQRDMQLDYLLNGLKHLGPHFSVLDANRPWVCYWILHSIALLGESIEDDLEKNTVDFLSRCQDPNGGYGGGPGQMPHIATTYAAVNALISLGGREALSSVNRDKTYSFLLRMKDASGAFRMHGMGEIDVRACYCAISVASILNILDDELVQNVGDYILSCQTYEGGIAGEPGSEAHGGYTFCGLATMILTKEVNRLDLGSLMDWVVHRQGIEMGFQGRTNKLVDGCYSFWQGVTCELLQRLDMYADGNSSLDAVDGPLSEDYPEADKSSDVSLGEEEDSDHHGDDGVSDDCDDDSDSDEGLDSAHHVDSRSTYIKSATEPLFDSLALQRYILLCSQVSDGGFRDKPGKARDFYHTCYCLSGLSVAQHAWSKDEDTPPLPRHVLGTYSNLLEPLHPLYNIILDRYHEAREFFSRQ